MLIFHRDLKVKGHINYLNNKEFLLSFLNMQSANVFLTKEGTVKLGDMNVSKVAKKGLLYTQTGTPYYAR